MTDAAVIARLRAAPDAALWIVRSLEKRGFETWAVGGAVRDACLLEDNEDWDFATRARPREIQKVFRRTVDIGADHGTIGVLKGHHLYEVTTFRRDVQPLGRRAIVEFADTLDEDLARRDFTFNALAWHPLREELKDPFDGIRDLRDGVLRTVGDPTERFHEDRLRVLRGLRFAARYALTPTGDTWAAMRESASELGNLSAERVREELTKLLAGLRTPSSGLSLYRDAGALAELYPELEALAGRAADDALEGSRWDRALRVADLIPRSRPLLRLAAMGAELVESAGEAALAAMLVRLRFSRAEADRVATWCTAQLDLPASGATPGERRRWLSRLDPTAVPGALRLAVARGRAGVATHAAERDQRVRRLAKAVRALRAECRARPPLTVAALEIDGRDVMRLGLRPGPQVGEILRTLLDRVLEDPAVNDRATLIEMTTAMIRGGSRPEEEELR